MLLEYLGAAGIPFSLMQQLQEMLQSSGPKVPTNNRLVRMLEYAIEGTLKITVSTMAGDAKMLELSLDQSARGEGFDRVKLWHS